MIPKIQMQHEEELKRKDREIRRLENDLFRKKETIRDKKPKRYCMNCLKSGHNLRTCNGDAVSKEERKCFQSMRIRKYKLKCKGWTKKRQKTQHYYYENNKEALKLKRK